MSAPRSKSVPAIRSTGREIDAEEDSSAFPPLPQDSDSDQRVPTWIQELAKSRAGRSSRASSVISTRTRFSTTTFDDTRSIEVQAGGQTFRIGRFGDRITDTTAPPPYSGPVTDDHHEYHDHWHPGDDHDEHIRRRRRNMGPGGARRQGRRVRIAMPNHEDATNANDDDSVTADTPSRVLTDEELRQIIRDLPAQLKTVLGIQSSQHGLENADFPESNDSEGHGRSRGPGSLHGSSYPATPREDRVQSNGYVRGILRNAPEHAPYHSDPSQLEGAEIRWKHPEWHNTHDTAASQPNRSPLRDSATNTQDEDDHGTVRTSSNTIPPESLLHHEIPVAPTIADLNELSQVYNKVIRDLDREHRKQLHDRDKELDQLRTLLHEKDIVYRQQLKGRDFVIDDMKGRLEHFEENMELRLEKERYAVEDLWETRWREHQTQLMEKCGLMRPALGRYTDHGSQTDD